LDEGAAKALGENIMMIFISGGVRSGKSTLGERLVSLHTGGRKVYFATSEVYDDEMTRRVEKHRLDRAGKGFITIEMSRDIALAASQLEADDAVLLDCLGTLAANEMFAEAFAQSSTDSVSVLAEKIYHDIMHIHSKVSLLVVISNEVFSDGIAYEKMTMEYIELLGKLHCSLAAVADTAIECTSSVITVHKGTLC
jgi:adenosylcobinamide kinase / adenosylcobinamide-phosphate guanylyltransferase